MKRFLLALVAPILLCSSVYATHLMGGEITARQLNGNDYEITLTVYRDTLGIPIAQNMFIEVTDDTGFPCEACCLSSGE